MRHLRGVLVLAHLVAISLMSLPAPVGGMRANLWDAAEGKAEIARWAGAIRGAGIPITDAQLRELAWAVGSGWLGLRTAFVAPLRPYTRWTGTRQSWRMFSMVPRQTARLAVHLDRGDGFEPLFVAGRVESWRPRQFRQERVRAFLSEFYALDSPRSWNGFVDWMAARAKEDFPDGKVLRAEIQVFRIPDPRADRDRSDSESRVEWRAERTLR